MIFGDVRRFEAGRNVVPIIILRAVLAVGAMVSRPVGGALSSASRRLGDHPSMRPTSGVSVPRD